MIEKNINEILAKREFIHVATCDLKGRPSVAPKFLLKIDSNFIYLTDYVFGRTWENLKINSKASLSVMDPEALTGYQMNGTVELIENGPAYDKLLNELKEKEINVSVERIIEGIHKGKKHKNFEVSFPERVVIFKVKIEEIVEITSAGKLERQKI